MDNDNLLSDLLTPLGTDSPDSTTSLNLESLNPALVPHSEKKL